MGTVLVLTPNFLLTLLGFAKTSEIWIRILGLFIFTTGIYYFYSYVHNQTAFYRATIVGRLFFFIITVIFVYFLEQSPILAIIGSVDLMEGLWTYFTINNKRP
jgi:hypothetical protein